MEKNKQTKNTTTRHITKFRTREDLKSCWQEDLKQKLNQY